MGKQRSITFTTMIFVGLITALIGVVFAALGAGDALPFEASLGDAKVKTESVGLALAAIGFGFAAFVAMKLPKGVTVLSAGPRNVGDRVADHAGPIAAAAGLAAAGSIVALLIAAV